MFPSTKDCVVSSVPVSVGKRSERHKHAARQQQHDHPNSMSKPYGLSLSGGNAMPLGGVGGGGDAARSVDRVSSAGVLSGAAAEKRMLEVRPLSYHYRPPPPVLLPPRFPLSASRLFLTSLIQLFGRCKPSAAVAVFDAGQWR